MIPLNNPFFEVACYQAYFSNPIIEMGVDKDNNYPTNYYQCPRHQAIVKVDNKSVLSITLKTWMLITNREAVDSADILADKLFDVSHLQCLHSTYNNYRDVEFNLSYYGNKIFSDSKNFDEWRGFVSITNNYKGSGALRYDFGFAIVNCDDVNIIFDDIDFNVAIRHTREDKINIDSKLANALSSKGFVHRDNYINKFISKIKRLRGISFEEDDILPLFLKFLEVKPTSKPKKTTKQKLLPVLEEVKVKFRNFKSTNLYEYMKQLSKFVYSSQTLRKYDALSKSDNNEDDDEETEIEVNYLPTIEDKDYLPQHTFTPSKIRKYQKRIGDFMNAILKFMSDNSDSLVEDYVSEFAVMVKALMG